MRRLLNQAFVERLIDDDGTVGSELADPFATLLGEDLAAEAEARLATMEDAPPTDRRPT